MKHGHEVAPWPKATASLIFGKELELFSIYFGENSAPSLSRPTSLARSMILRCPVCVEEAGVAGLAPSRPASWSRRVASSFL